MFGPGPEENYTQNVKSGKKVQMRMKSSGSYMLVIDMGKTGKAEVCVDSGAEESFCPVTWGGWENFQSKSQSSGEDCGERMAQKLIIKGKEKLSRSRFFEDMADRGCFGSFVR